MTIIRLKPKEISDSLLEQIKSIDSENITPYLTDPFTMITGIVTDENDEIIAVGLTRIVNEWKLIVNKDKTPFELARGIKELAKQAIAYGNLHGANEVFATITQGGEHYEKILKKHFGFKDVEGTQLKLEI